MQKQTSEQKKSHPFFLQAEKIYTATTSRKGSIIRFFPDVSMSNGHAGLAKIAAEKRINVANLEPGEYAVFVNKPLTAFKMFAPGNVVAHKKMPPGLKLDLGAIKYLPKHFNGTEINYDAALKETLTKRFEGKLN